MAPALVQSNNAEATGANTVPVVLGNTTTGNTLVACGQVNGSSNALSSVTGTGVTFVDVGTGTVYISGLGSIQCYVAKNITGQTTPTITGHWASAAGAHNLHVLEISGINLTTPIDSSQFASNTSSIANPSVSLTTVNPNDFLIGYAAFLSSTSVGANMTLIINDGTTLSEYRIVSAAGTYTVTVSENNIALAGSIIGFALAGVVAAVASGIIYSPIGEDHQFFSGDIQ